jgi:hypothetical protein
MFPLVNDGLSIHHALKSSLQLPQRGSHFTREARGLLDCLGELAHRHVILATRGGKLLHVPEELTDEGDAFFYAFADAGSAVTAAAAANDALVAGPIRIRLAVLEASLGVRRALAGAAVDC